MNYVFKNKIQWLLFLLIVTISSSSFAQGIRKDYQEMTNDERDALVNAYWALGGTSGTSGLNSDIAIFHDNNFSDIHFNVAADDVFLAWHRQASHELERAMKNNANNEWITTAYWDWTLSNSKSDALWGNSWLGPFNSPWNLSRLTTAPFSLPTQSDINTALLESNFYQFSRFELESDPLHTGAHGWVGGTMASGSSPKDPVFFFHHNMVDKIWADWYEIYGVAGANYYAKTDMPRYPNVDPDNIADPRSLGIFYAEAGFAVLDKYTVSNTHTPSEKFGYQYTIQADDDFDIPSGKDAEFRSCQLIQLLPGFTASDGSTFLAKIDADCDFTTAALVAGEFETQKENQEQRIDDTDEEISGNSIRVFPNPFIEQTGIDFTLESESLISLEVSNVAGQKVRSIINNQMFPAGNHNLIFDAAEMPDGIYYCSLISGTDIKTIKLVLQ